VELQTDAVDHPGTRRRITEPLSGAVWLTTCVIVAGIGVPLLLTPLLGGRIGILGIDWIPLLLLVCGVLTLARIIRIGAQMHDDLAGTV
jgi:hypothetical protein